MIVVSRGWILCESAFGMQSVRVTAYLVCYHTMVFCIGIFTVYYGYS